MTSARLIVHSWLMHCEPVVHDPAADRSLVADPPSSGGLLIVGVSPTGGVATVDRSSIGNLSAAY
jgi:hypothetical protein